MTRVVAGSARGRRLKVPADGTRPTSDRVREALFSSLDARAVVRGSRVLDLYAGTGALGLEAASRGAAEVVLVDSAAQAVKIMTENARVVARPSVTVRRAAVTDFLAGPSRPFDLVLLDPPYDLPRQDVEAVLEQVTAGWLAEEATVVVERGRRDPEVRWPVGFDDHWERRFGDTHVLRAVWYGRLQDPQP